MGSVAVSDESSELVSRLALRRYQLSKQELMVYRRAMARGDPSEARINILLGHPGWGYGKDRERGRVTSTVDVSKGVGLTLS